jgi:hypothetical protein
MKTRYEYVRQYLNDYDDYIDYVADVCREAGYSSIDDAYVAISNRCDEEPTPFNGYKTAEDYWVMTLIEGIYDYEKQLIKAHKRYDRILEKLTSKKNLINNKVLADELFEMKRRDERFRARLEEASRRHDEMIDELVSKYKTDDVEEA